MIDLKPPTIKGNLIQSIVTLEGVAEGAAGGGAGQRSSRLDNIPTKPAQVMMMRAGDCYERQQAARAVRAPPPRRRRPPGPQSSPQPIPPPPGSPLQSAADFLISAGSPILFRVIFVSDLMT